MTESERLTYKGKTPNIAYSDYSVREIINKLAEYEDIGTAEEFKALKEKAEPKKSEWKHSRKENIATCKNCSYEHYLGTYHQYARKYCPNCGCEND